MKTPSDMQRTSCSCQFCAIGCKTMPGSLAPGDLEEIQAYVDDSSEEFVARHFRVSEGAKVLAQVGGESRIFAVPSLVPAQQPDGRCVFLGDDDRCKIHAVSPFGCSYFDTHMLPAEGDRRLKLYVQAQLRAHHERSPYSQWCQRLSEQGLTAAPLASRRAAMSRMFDEAAAEQHAKLPQRETDRV